MDSPLFVNHYRTLCSALSLSGLATPWIQNSSPLSRLVGIVWDNFFTFTNVYMFCCYVFTLMTIYVPLQDLSSIGISATNVIMGLFTTFYFDRYSRRLKDVTDGIDSIARTISRNPMGHQFHQQYAENAKLMNLFTIISVSMGTFQPMVFVVSSVGNDIFGGRYRSQFPLKINSPFDDKRPGVYELIILVMIVSICSGVAKKIVADCLFLTLFRTQKYFLQYLSTSVALLQKDFQSVQSSILKRNIVSWVSLDQQVLKNIQELVAAYSPFIIFNYLCLICNLVSAAFVVTMRDNGNIFQMFSVSLYSVVVLAYLFLISDVAHQLTLEVQNLSFQLYSTSWYDKKKEITDIIKLVTTMSNRPIQVTAKRTSVFLLNRESYAGFLATTLSAFLTFCQIKEKLEE